MPRLPYLCFPMPLGGLRKCLRKFRLSSMGMTVTQIYKDGDDGGGGGDGGACACGGGFALLGIAAVRPCSRTESKVVGSPALHTSGLHHCRCRHRIIMHNGLSDGTLLTELRCCCWHHAATAIMQVSLAVVITCLSSAGTSYGLASVEREGF